MSDTNLVQLFALKEVTWGVTPAAAMAATRFTGEGLAFNIESTTSAEIRSDRQISDLIQTGAEASGNVDIELSYGTYDQFMEGALGNLFVNLDSADDDNGIVTSGSIVGNLDFSLDLTTNEITLGSSVVHNIVVGQWIRLTGSAADDGFHKVTTVVGQVIGVESLTTTEVLDETDLATLTGSMVRNGVTQMSWTMEKFFSDITQYISFTGMMVNSMALTMETDAILTGNFDFLGKDSAIAAASVGTGGPTAATTTQVMNAVSHVSGIREGGALLTGTFISAMDVNVAANLRPQKAIGNLGAVAVGLGQLDVNGNLTVYFEDEVLYNKYLNNTETSVSFVVQDAVGNAYIVTLPRVKYGTATVVAGGINSDVLAEMSYQAILDSVTGCTIQIDKFAI